MEVDGIRTGFNPHPTQTIDFGKPALRLIYKKTLLRYNEVTRTTSLLTTVYRKLINR